MLNRPTPLPIPMLILAQKYLNRHVWGQLIDGLVNDLRKYKYPGGQHTVGENIRFKGGHCTFQKMPNLQQIFISGPRVK